MSLFYRRKNVIHVWNDKVEQLMKILISGWTVPLINNNAGGQGCVNLLQSFVWLQIQFRPIDELKRSEASPTSFFFLATFPVLESLRLSSRAIWSRRSSPRRILSSWTTTQRHTKEFMSNHTHIMECMPSVDSQCEPATLCPMMMKPYCCDSRWFSIKLIQLLRHAKIGRLHIEAKTQNCVSIT